MYSVVCYDMVWYSRSPYQVGKRGRQRGCAWQEGRGGRDRGEGTERGTGTCKFQLITLKKAQRVLINCSDKDYNTFGQKRPTNSLRAVFYLSLLSLLLSIPRSHILLYTFLYLIILSSSSHLLSSFFKSGFGFLRGRYLQSGCSFMCRALRVYLFIF